MEANINLLAYWQDKSPNVSLWKRVFNKGINKTKALSTPSVILQKCNGISLGEKVVKSLIFSTDMALIENNDSDAVLAVYPFSPSPRIMKSLIDFSDKPVICGIGGGLTQGKIALKMAQQAEQLGAAALIVNQPFKNKDIEKIKSKVSLPFISSVSVSSIDFKQRVNAGVDIFHITGGANTHKIIEYLMYAVPGYPLMATGGKTLESIQLSIKTGADAIVLTPPSSSDLFKSIMNTYRKGINYLKK